MTRYFRKIWAALLITSLLVTQTGSAFARVRTSPDSPTVLAAPVLLAPADGTLTNNATPAFSWEDQLTLGAVEYHLQLDDNIGFLSPVEWFPTNASYTLLPGEALGDGLHYWRVQSSDGAWSGWSETWSLTVDATPPDVPGLLNPADVSFTNDNTPTFSWEPVVDAVTYHLQIATDNGFVNLVFDQTTNLTSLTSSLLADGQYFWQVNAADALGNTSAWSGVRSFTVDTALPAVPILDFPANGASINDNTPTLTWQIAEGASQYRIQVNNNNNFNNPSINQLVGDTNFTVASTMSDGTYYWRVQALDEAGNQSTYSASRSFTVDTDVPGVPNLNSPGVNALLNDNTPAFAWSSAAGASQYQIQVGDNSDFTTTLIDELVGVTNFTPLSAISDGVYYWRVRALDAAGNLSAFSSFRSFTIDTTAPDVPGLLLPTDGSLTTDNTPTFTWSASTGAAQYTLQVSVSNTFSPLAVNQPLPGTSFAPGISLPDGLYYWRVNATDLAGNTSDWSTPTWSLTIDTTPPAVPVLAAPAHGTLTNDNTPTFSWNASTGTAQYRIQVSTASDFTSTAVDETLGSTSFSPPGSLADGLYYWRVNATDQAGNTSAWSTPTWSLTIDATPPGVPDLLSPADASSTADNTPPFTWNASTGAAQYRIQVSTASDFTSTAVDETLGSTSFSPPGSLADGLYYWRVNATDQAGNTSAWSLVRSLTVDTLLPGMPILLSPADASFTSNTTPTFSWEPVTGASQYRLQVSVAQDFGSTVINLTQAGTSFTPGISLADGLYYWRVNAIDPANNIGPWSAVWSLTIDTLPPAVPLLLAPAEGAALNDTTPDFSWEAVIGATSYRLQIGLNGNFSPPTQNLVVNGSNFTLLEPLIEGNYSWRVRASDAAGNASTYSSPRTFIIDTTPPGVPILADPANGTLINDNTPTFTWGISAGASQYQIQVDNNNDFSSPLIDELAGSPSFTPLSSLPDGTLYWHVRAIDAASNVSGWSVAWSVMIDATAPGTPTLAAPADGFFTSDITPTFSWNSVADAVQYRVQASTLSNFSLLAIDQTLAGLTYTPLSGMADSLYYWRVQAIDLAGNPSSWSVVRSFTVDTQPPATPTLAAPVDGSISSDNTPTFTWNASAGASQYRIQVDNNNNFLTPEIDEWVGATTFTPISGLVDGTYFWHVQARDAADNLSGWSAAWSVVVDATAPGVPSLLAPTDASLTNDNTPAFNWSAVAGASSYTFQVSTTADFSSLTINQTPAGTSFTPGNPMVDGVYYWRVNAIDSVGNPSDWSAVWSLTIDTAPPLAPTLLAPADASVTADSTPLFSWSASTGASQYTLQVSTVNTFVTTVIDQTQPGTSFAPGSVLTDGLYYWRVNAVDLAGNISAWSAVRSLTVDALAPGVPSLLAPVDGAALSDTTPDFSWSAVVDAVSYRLQIDTDNNFSPPILQNLNVNSASFTLVTPLTEGVYYWRVRASDAAGNNSAYSTVRTFTIDTTPPPAPVLAAPANGATANDSTPAFSWNASTGASQYQIQVDDSNDFLSPIISELAGSTSFTPLSSLADGTYYWHVRAIDAAGNLSGWSATWSLVVDATAPPAPALIAPLDGASTNDNTPTFSWNAVAGAAQYQLQVDDDDIFTSLRYEQFTVATSVTPTSALSDALLFWRVRARDAIGNWGEWSILRSFTIDTVPPAAPALVAPLDGTLTADNMPVFSWSSVAGAVSYRLVVDTSGGFSSPYIIDQTISGLSYAAPGPISDGNYIWRVRATDAAGNQSSYSVTRSFTIDTTASTVPTLIEPANGGITADSTPAFTWGASIGAVLYFIQVDNNSNFSSPLIDTSTANTNYTPAALPDGTYFWHVQARDAADNMSGWSTAWSLVVDSTPPGMPSLVSPSDGLVTNDNTPTFTWSIPPGAVQTNIQVDDNNNFSSPLVEQTVGGASFTWGTTIADGSYFWRVQALDAATNTSNWSASRSLTIDTAPPGPFLLIAPAPGGSTVDSTPTFDWEEPAGATQYRLQVGVGDSFTSLVIDVTINQGEYTAILPLAQGLYSWRVTAGDAAGNWGDPTERRELTVYSLANLPFSDGFESGALGGGWSVILRNEGRIRVTNLGPGTVNSGSFSLFLDDYLAGSNTSASQAVAILTSDLAGASVATLSFAYRSFGSAQSADSVYISDNYGANWCKILQFASNQSTYKAEQFNLVAEAARCNMVLNDHFQVKWQFFGFYGISDGVNAEGFGIDNVQLVGLWPAAYLPLIGK